jgi:hypothetical protein
MTKRQKTLMCWGAGVHKGLPSNVTAIRLPLGSAAGPFGFYMGISPPSFYVGIIDIAELGPHKLIKDFD